MKKLTTYRLIEVKYHHHGNRISLTDKRPIQIGEPSQRKYFNVDYSYDSFLRQAHAILTQNGWNIVGQAEMNLLSDSWDWGGDHSTYPQIKNLKKL